MLISLQLFIASGGFINHVRDTLESDNLTAKEIHQFMRTYYGRQLDMMPHRFFNTVHLTHDRFQSTSLQALRRDRVSLPESQHDDAKANSDYSRPVLMLMRRMMFIIERVESDHDRYIRINNRIREWSVMVPVKDNRYIGDPWLSRVDHTSLVSKTSILLDNDKVSL